MILTVSDAGWQFGEAERVCESGRQQLQSYFPGWNVSGVTHTGSPMKSILQESSEWIPDLMVVGSHGRSTVVRLLLGSVSLGLIHHAPCSIRVARTGTSCGVGPIRVVVCNDGSEEAESALRVVLSRTWPEKTEVHVISVAETLTPAREALAASTFAQEPAFTVINRADKEEWKRIRDVSNQSVQRLSGAGLIGRATVVEGDPRREIIAEAIRSNADVIFLGARGLSRIERLLLGSISTHVIAHAPCSVEVVRQTQTIQDDITRQDRSSGS
jgi:nucleotide-binding universal stress UspA family protein